VVCIPTEEVVPELLVLVLALAMQRLGEVTDAATYLRREFGPRLGHRLDRRPCTVQVPAGGEGDIIVVDALPVPPPLTLVEWHIAAVPPRPGGCYDMWWQCHIILRPWR
jgi:hypothetical protein